MYEDQGKVMGMVGAELSKFLDCPLDESSGQSQDQTAWGEALLAGTNYLKKKFPL